jgi:deoxyribodipyrimidine photo-lyase
LKKNPLAIFWFRRDLRLDDNAGLFHALKCGLPVLPLFIFDTEILDKLPNKTDPRLDFIHQALLDLQQQLLKLGSSLQVVHGEPADVFTGLLSTHAVQSVFANSDYEPQAIKRDEAIARLLAAKNSSLHLFKDQVIFEKSDVVKDDGNPYTVFTPFMRKWKSRLQANSFYPFPSIDHTEAFLKMKAKPIPDLGVIGFNPAGIKFSKACVDHETVKNYKDRRDFPALEGTTRISVHLRFGIISIRKLAILASDHSDTWLNELIWREFYMMILFHFPYVVSGAFKKQYNAIRWRNNEAEFDRWCSGTTGYPIVDAGMRELNQTRFMHNRLRMITASFLVKDLLIDWRWGEAYFAEKLIDFELASNNGGWQWATGSGCDAAPYFRVFSPEAQTKKFDPDFAYIQKWVPEWQDINYPPPLVDHKLARIRVLKAFKTALSEDNAE